MSYHILLLSIYEPLLDAKTDHNPSPRHIVINANKHLQTLIRLYYLRHGFEAMDAFLTIPLILAGSKCLDAINEQTPVAELEVLRSTLLLITSGLSSQRRNHYLAEALFRVIRGRMRPQEAALMRGTIDLEKDEGQEKRVMIQAVRSHWPVGVVRKIEDKDSNSLRNLVKKYAHLNAEDGTATAGDSQ